MSGPFPSPTSPRPAGRYVVPKPQALQTLGVLNLIFGLCLALGGAMVLTNAISYSTTGRSMNALAEAIEIQSESAYEQRLARLEELERQAERDAAKERFRETRLELEEQGPEPPGDLAMFTWMSDLGPMSLDELTGPIVWLWVEGTTGILLNTLLIATGFGMLERSDWGRRLALWVAGIKIGRLVVLYGVALVLIVPAVSRALGESVDEMMAAQGAAGGGGPPPGFIGQAYAIAFSVLCVVMILFGVIYPIILLRSLTRPGVKAACLPVNTPAAEPSRPSPTEPSP